MFKIDKNIPIPSRTSGRPTIYPFSQMKIGDSFLIMNTKGNGKYPADKSVRQAARKYMGTKNKTFKITVRRVSEKGGKHIRVWRSA